jgi:DNA repair exonuclease SbcCD ATPase subunit
MIILKHLTVERFRLLREINLHFPQRGSILIQGINEAGKSTLFESIYFALYGESLASERKKHSQAADGRYDDLILYGENQATVTLTLTIGPTELTIMRSIERGKGQSVVLNVRKLGMPAEELITNLEAANVRIIAEIGHIDAATLRNSCFIEQKALSRLEHLSGSEREASLRKLLGLEKLTRLSEQFKVTAEDERLLAECADLLQLAEVQNRIPDLSMQLGQLEAALDALTIREDLAGISRQEAEIAEQELALEQLQHKRAELKVRQNRIQQLKKAQSILDEIIAAYENIAEAQRQLPELERQLADVERRERDELPALEQRVRDLSDLSRSFGTLERMAADLLAAVNTIKDLEQTLKQYEQVQEQLAELDDQIMQAHLLADEVQQSQHELETQHHSARPQFEARLQRLHALSARLTAVEEAEQAYARRQANRTQAEENGAELARVRAQLQETEQELALVEHEAEEVQQRTDAIEKRWRQLSIGHQLEEWQRVKGLSKGFADAEQHVVAAHQQQEQYTLAALAIRRTATAQLGIFIACVVLLILCGGGAVVEALRQSYIYATLGGVAALLLIAGAGLSLQNYGKTREKERQADQQMQEAISRVGMMVTARETAARVGGGYNALAQVEHEIRSLGGTVPGSIEEARHLLQQIPDQDESLADLQQRLTEGRNQAIAARSQVNVTMEAVAALSKQQAQLQDLRQSEGWDNIDEILRADQENIARLRSEIATTAGEEGLSIPVAPAPVASDVADSPPSDTVTTPADAQLRAEVEEAIKATEREIAALDGKMDVLPELLAQLKVYQDTLDVLLARKQAVMKQNEHFLAGNPMQQFERARQQQFSLRDALRALQDSLRQRVKTLGVSFGQTAISTAESAARKQLEALHITLDSKLEIQDRHTAQATMLKECQESLSEHYRQLSKCSSSLGSWIIPPDPFAETLHGLHDRCEREVQEADEPGILSEFEALKTQEGALQGKIELCKHDIEQAYERIAALLAQRSRPTAKTYTLADITAVWPLVGENSPEDRTRLEEQLAAVEQELRQLEQQELEASTRLGTSKERLDLEQSRKRMQQAERSYQTKKHGGLLINATVERLMRKMLPRTEYYMQQLLPLLTRGRYHDVSLATEPEEGIASGGTIQLGVWEPAAAEYIPQSALSGGAADQISLALRLAFAIAALPRELGAAPGYLLLDEPLSLASHDRMQALVDLVTGSLLSQHFEQIFFISHSNAFDPAMFPYHIYIDNGLVIQCNLPPVSAPSLLEMPDSSNGNVAASSTSESDLISPGPLQDLSELTI